MTRPLFSLAVVAMACLTPVTYVHAEEATSWKVDKSATQIAFTGTQSGDPFTGEFKAFDIAINFDPDNLEGSSIRATIDTGSGDTGDRQRDKALPGKDWFHTKEYPTAEFVSTEINQAGEGRYEAVGILTIKNIEQPLVLPFDLSIDGDKAEAKATVSLVRSDFQVGLGEFKTGKWVGLDVGVDIKVTATK
ncbi:MAG: YceI family protein [Pseudomonadota bacterium]